MMNSIVNQINKADSLQQAKSLDALSYSENMQSTQEERIRKAKKVGDRLIKEAVASGDFWQQKSYRKEGLAWLDNRVNRDQRDKDYAARIKQAKADAKTLIETEMAATNQATKAYTLTQQDTSYNKKIDFLTTIGKASLLSHQQKKITRTKFFYLFDFIAAISMLIAVRVRVLRKIAAGDQGSDRSLASTLSRALDSWYYAFIDFIEGLLMIDVNGDGQLGNSKTPQKQQNIEAAGQNVGQLLGTTVQNETSETNVKRPVIQGFQAGRNKQGETSQMKQESETTETHVQRGSQLVSPKVKQRNETSETKLGATSETIVKQESETVIIVDSNERYLRQRCRQSYRRMQKPSATQTPAENYKKYKKQLEFLGYEVTPKKQLNTVWFSKDGKEWK